MLGQVVVQGLLHIARGGVLTEVCGSHCTFQIFTEVGTTGVAQRTVGAVVNHLTGLELYLATIIYTRYATEGEHQREVLCPLAGTASETYAVVGLGAVVV